MAELPEREQIAHRCGFHTYADLLDVSDHLPLRPGDQVRSYIARRPNDRWFVWGDPTQAAPKPGDPSRDDEWDG